MKIVAAVAGAAAVMLLTAPQASADTTEDELLNSLEQHGFVVTSQQGVIEGAIEICSALDHGMPYNVLLRLQQNSPNNSLSPARLQEAVNLAIAAYCPDIVVPDASSITA